MEIVKDELDVKKEAPVAKYDPNKRYKWEKDATFVLTGNDFGLVLNALRAIISTPEAQRILLADKASQAIEMSLAASVEAGQTKEIPQEKK